MSAGERTGRIARVRGPTARATASTSICSVPGSMSTKTGLAPTARIMFAVAAHVIAVVMTSSPGPIPAARSARWRPPVAELTATACRAPVAAAKASSNRPRRGPPVSQPDSRHSVTAPTSAGPIVGRESGKKVERIRALHPDPPGSERTISLTRGS